MKVKITKDRPSSYWYAGRIGETFEVTEAENRYYYIVQKDYGDKDYKITIDKDDCEVIQEEKTQDTTKELPDVGANYIPVKEGLIQAGDEYETRNNQGNWYPVENMVGQERHKFLFHNFRRPINKPMTVGNYKTCICIKKPNYDNLDFGLSCTYKFEKLKYGLCNVVTITDKNKAFTHTITLEMFNEYFKEIAQENKTEIQKILDQYLFDFMVYEQGKLILNHFVEYYQNKTK